MTDPQLSNRGPVLGPFVLGVIGASIVLLIVVLALPSPNDLSSPPPDPSLIALVFATAFFWSGVIRLLFTQAPHGVPAAGYASVSAVLGLVMMLLTLDPLYLAFLFVSFICLFLGRVGERAARWVFPERFRS